MMLPPIGLEPTPNYGSEPKSDAATNYARAVLQSQTDPSYNEEEWNRTIDQKLKRLLL